MDRQEVPEDAGELLPVVAHHHLAPELHAVGLQGLGQAEGVGVQTVRAQELRAHGDDGGAHGPRMIACPPP